MPRNLYAHSDEDFLPLEPEAADDVAGGVSRETELAVPDLAVPPVDVSNYIRLAAGIYASGAGGAFMERRLQLQAKHGPSARTDLSRPLYTIVADSRDSLLAVLDRIRGGRPDAEALELARRSLDTAGALLLAARDVLDQELTAAIARERADPEPRP